MKIFKLKIPGRSGQKGFLALISAIIISAVLLIVIFSVSFSGFMTRFNILDSEYKATSYSLAESYANEAMLKLAQNISNDSTYMNVSNTETTPVTGDDYYSIEVIPPSGVVIRAHAVYQKAVTNIMITGTFSGGSFSISGWREVSSF